MAIRLGESEIIRKRWEKAGRPVCEHKNLIKEIGPAGGGTGDYICGTCGDSGWGSNWPQKEREEGQKEEPIKLKRLVKG